ncbi:MAG TPA: S-methyl-5-thioribose-1-phosphate isomerase [Pirellulales bacterium]|jgi:methylthioribose-1-phosphate isomerase
MSESRYTQTLYWVGGIDGCLRLIDQTRLPLELVEIDCTDTALLWEALRSLRVRGAPAIGVAAAFGVCLGVRDAVDANEDQFFAKLNETVDYLATSRPTAVNLFWALARMKKKADDLRGKFSPREIAENMLVEAQAIWQEDRETSRAIGKYGAELLRDGQGVLTHCNAGALVTVDYGTALAPIFAAQDAGKRLHVYVDETRPLLQGARLTAWELQQRGIAATLICDSMAAQVMREGRVQAVIVGADRIAANGDTANKIGTYGVALLAAAHHIPFYVAAPQSTFDLSLAAGEAIPIEQRPAEEITHGFGRQTAPTGIDVYNPAFDVTPARLIRAIICEHGVIEPVNREQITKILKSS